MNASDLNLMREVVNEKMGTPRERNQRPHATRFLCLYLMNEGLNGSETGFVLGVSRQAVSKHLIAEGISND